MPGVPTSRGCDACRKRKIKCDASTAATTACSRCRQLNIPCVGFGQQRYIFKDEGRKLTRRHRELFPSTNVAGTLLKPHATSAADVGMVREPSNKLTRLAHAFASKASLSIDISHQLVGNFGGFILEVPRRIGTSEALDAAADTLVTAHTKYCIGQLSPNTETLVKHSRALNALQRCLNDPIKARSSETLCSVMLLSICEVGTCRRTSKNAVHNHYIGAAQILKSRGFSGPPDDFERTLLLTLRGPVVAFTDPKIRFTKDEWQSLVVPGLSTGGVDGDLMVCLSHIPDLMDRTRDVLQWPDELGFSLQETRSALQRLHDEYRPVLKRLRERWEGIDENLASRARTPESRRMTHCHYSRMLALGLSVGIIINYLRAYLEHGDGALQQDSTRMSEEILELSATIAVYRPLGSSVMILSLGAAWIGATDIMTKAIIETIAAEYFKDIYGPNYTFTIEDLDFWLKRFRISS
ncbi:MAG: hypothetical protein Q9167_000609 [Letrouitia subvulpina]